MSTCKHWLTDPDAFGWAECVKCGHRQKVRFERTEQPAPPKSDPPTYTLWRRDNKSPRFTIICERQLTQLRLAGYRIDELHEDACPLDMRVVQMAARILF